MKLSHELHLAAQCAKRGLLVGAFAGAVENNIWMAAGIGAVFTAGIYLTVKSNQIAAAAEAKPKAVL